MIGLFMLNSYSIIIPPNEHDTYSYCLGYFSKALELCRVKEDPREDYHFRTKRINNRLEGQFRIKEQ